MPISAKGCKIVSPHKKRRRLLHLSHVQCIRIRVHILSLKHNWHRTCMNPIAVCLGRRMVAAVKTLLHLYNLSHRNVLRQIAVQSLHEFLPGKIVIDMKIRHLSHRMHARIRSSAADHFHRMSCQRQQYMLQLSLNCRICRLLNLPAPISGSVILYCYSVILHILLSYALPFIICIPLCFFNLTFRKFCLPPM